jgi:hypothetical protein
LHSTSKNTTATQIGITVTGNGTMADTITQGVPMTGDTAIRVIASIGMPTAAGNHMTRGIREVRKATTAVMAVGNAERRLFRFHGRFDSRKATRGIDRVDSPGWSLE